MNNFHVANACCSSSLLVECKVCLSHTRARGSNILGDPGADSGGEGKSKRAGKYGTKKSIERQEEPLGTMSYQTSSKRSPPFWVLSWQKNTKVFWHQSAARTAVTVWNWSGKTLSPGALFALLYFSFVPYFSARLDFLSPPLSAPRSPRMGV